MSDHQQPSPDCEGQGSGENEKQHDDKDYKEKHLFQSDLQEHSTSSQRRARNESRRTEHHQSSFQSARSVFESTSVSGTKLIKKDEVTASKTVIQSSQTVNKLNQVSSISHSNITQMDKFGKGSAPFKQPPDKPDRKSKTASAKCEGSSPHLFSGATDLTLDEGPEESNWNHPVEGTTKLFDDLHDLPQHDSV